jgi:hypothetical protein
MSQADSPDGRWMTYEELAADRGISEASARRLVRRHKTWRRQADNRGIVRVFVPPDALEPREIVRKDVRADDRVDSPKDVSADIPKVMMILETAIASLTARAEHAEQIADQERQRAEAAETQIAAERQARQDADTRAAAAERDSQAARAEAMRLRETERERRTLGLLDRLRAAWRNE